MDIVQDELSLVRLRSLILAVEREAVAVSGYINLVANEASMSRVARQFMGSQFGERYFSGPGNSSGFADFGVFTAMAMPCVDALLQAAISATRQMLGAAEVNLNTLSGMHAMTCVLLGISDPGDTIMTLRTEDGGHFATKSVIERIGRKHVFAVLDSQSGHFNRDATAALVKMHCVKALYLDIMYSVRPFDVKAIRTSLPQDVRLVFDASHLVGLILGGAIPSPLRQGADILCANTHKTLPGPHKGLIAFRERCYGEQVNQRVKSFYSTTHCHHTLALAVALLEMYHFGATYASHVVENANALGQALTDLGLRVRRVDDECFTRTHQLHVDLAQGERYSDLCAKLTRNRISVTFTNGLGGGVFMRIGTQEVTRRGMTAPDMQELARLIGGVMKGKDMEREVRALHDRFPEIRYSFDQDALFSQG